MRSGDEFRLAIGRGSRGSGRSLVVAHVAVSAAPAGPAVVGFVVSKAVGTAVTRNRVKRRLRALARERRGRLPGGSYVVLRALPESANATWEQLSAAVDKALGTALRRQQEAPCAG